MTILFNNIIKSPYIQSLIFNHVREMNMWEYVWSKSLGDVLYAYAPSLEWIEAHKDDSMMELGNICVGDINAYISSKNYKRITLKTFLYLVDRYQDVGGDIDEIFKSDMLHLHIAQGGSIEIMKYVLERGKLDGCSIDLIPRAAQYNRLPMVKFIMENSYQFKSEEDSKDILKGIDEAAKNGNLEIVECLMERCKKGSSKAINIASKHGHLSIVKFLTEGRVKGSCTAYAVDEAAENGFMEIVQYLMENRTEGCTTEAIDTAAMNGHLSIVQYLNENSTKGCTNRAIDKAAANGHLSIVKYLSENSTQGCSTDAMDKASLHGHLSIVQYLNENRTEGCTTDAIDSAAYYGNMSVIKYLLDNRTEGFTSEAISYAIEQGHIQLVKFLGDLEPNHIIMDSIETASMNGSLEMVKYLIDKIPVDYDLEWSLCYAAGQGNLPVYEYLHQETMGEHLMKSVKFTLQHGHVNIIQFIIDCIKSEFDGQERDEKLEELKQIINQQHKQYAHILLKAKWAKFMLENGILSLSDTHVQRLITDTFIYGESGEGDDLEVIQYLAPFIKNKSVFEKAKERAFECHHQSIYRFISTFMKDNGVDKLPE